ncbi:glycoside hydrolase family 3 C-terminal domain-containing protein [Lachnotalea glycerini]|uniref:Glycoside hydrolase family 3 protein n=1 Tax=Lachnotalea glycerini TaxID=1763509 RepID=A0A371JHH9_9FIRM|nr:glycoside hydrolase family 3 C-terminal domain-containing protein [Lachnotalea glycerini]RDY32189.1 glycoside hydrolase family 3 protein [Lachnotalea glycerini]
MRVTPYNMKREKYQNQARKLVEQMTLEEKVFQTLHSAPAIERLGIKSYNWWNEALHGVARAGVATVFPQAIGLAATFDEEVLKKVGKVVSTEGRAKFNMQQKYKDTDIYKGLTFWAPNVNIFRDPRWGRGHETFGEDPYLTSCLGVSFIKAMQGDGEYMKTAACAKHFAVHSGPEDVRHSFDARVTLQDLHETYLPAFKACVEKAEVETVMGAYNRTNGEPCCGSKTLLKDILRTEWNFKGHVTSDCWAIKDFHEHHKVTNGPVESVALAMNNGCDLNCGNIFIYLKKAVEDGLVNEERLNEAVTNLFVTRMKLGLFEKTKTPFDAIDYDKVDCPEHCKLNKDISKKTLVLLKNENQILPLKKDSLKTIGIIGPNANNRKALVGNYEGTASEYITVLEGIKEYVGENTRVLYSEGCHLFKEQISGLGEKNDRIAEVKAVCDKSDVVIACMGLDSGLEGEEGDQGNEFASGDKLNLQLPGLQEQVLKAIYESGKPVVLILLSGSALAVNFADEHIPAIVQGWYPGTQGGRAIAEVLFGENSPEGKLPITFYKTTEELPDFTDYSMKNRTYRYMTQEALYPFGYGLTYTDIDVIKVEMSQEQISKDDTITVKAMVKNQGKMAGGEVIQLYIQCVGKDMPNYSLKGLKKVHLKAQEEVEIIFTLDAASFGLYDEEARLKLYQGTYKVYIGISQPDERSVKLTKKRPICKVIKCMSDEVLYHPSIYE